MSFWYWLAPEGSNFIIMIRPLMSSFGEWLIRRRDLSGLKQVIGGMALTGIFCVQPFLSDLSFSFCFLASVKWAAFLNYALPLWSSSSPQGLSNRDRGSQKLWNKVNLSSFKIMEHFLQYTSVPVAYWVLFNCLLYQNHHEYQILLKVVII